MRQEDKTISNDLQDFSIAADERPGRRKGNGDGPPKRKPSEAVASKGAGSLIWVLCLVLAGVTGFHFWQINTLQGNLDQTREELTEAKKLLSHVTGEVSATGENLNKNESAIQDELKTVNSEIRKLWDLANKRNRQAIDDNEERLAQLSKKVDKGVAQSDNVSAAVKKASAQLSDLEGMLKAVTSEQLVVKSEVSASMEALREQLEQVNKLTGEQKKSQTDTQKSLDDYRSQVNRKLLQLENSLRALSQPKEGGL